MKAEIAGGRNRCPCGGLLVMRGKKQKDKHCLTHILIKCQKCGAWFGGYTSRPKRN